MFAKPEFKGYVQVMTTYNRWMNERIFDSCAKLSDEERKRDRGAFFKSLHGTLNHLLLADRVWLGRFTGQPFRIESLAQELYSDFDELRSERAITDSDIEQWIKSVPEHAWAEPLSYTRLSSPKQATDPLWFTVAHFFNHQTHHRGQITALLCQSGVDPGVTDLIRLPDMVWHYGQLQSYID